MAEAFFQLGPDTCKVDQVFVTDIVDDDDVIDIARRIQVPRGSTSAKDDAEHGRSQGFFMRVKNRVQDILIGIGGDIYMLRHDNWVV